jgi:hypothetical protein
VNASVRRAAQPQLESLEDRLVLATATGASFVPNAIQTLLNRAYDPNNSLDAGLQTQYSNGQINTLDVANQIEQSSQGVAANVQFLFNTVLLRNPDPTGEAYFTGILTGDSTHGAASIQTVRAIMEGSPEFYALYGGTDAGWLNGVYSTQVGREVDSIGSAYWLPALTTGDTAVASRTSVALQIINSPEGTLDTTRALFTRLLSRPVDPTGLNYWSPILQTTPIQTVMAEIVASDEFFNRS